MLRTVASYTIWPLLVVGETLLLYGFLQEHPAQTPLAIGATALAGFPIFAGLEAWLPLRTDWRLKGDRELGSDVVHTISATQLGVHIGEWLIPLYGVVAVGHLGLAPLVHLWPTSWPHYAQIILLVFCADGLEYGLHRLTHTVSWLWPLHIVHHTPERLHIFKAGRHHFAYFVVRHLVVLSPFLFLGAPAAVVLWYPLAIIILGPIAHANLALRVPPWLHKIILTPDVHRLHHSLDLKQGNSNYALVFPFWDIVFGTFCDPTKEPLGAVGLCFNPLPRRIVVELAAPFIWPQLVARVQREEAKA